MQVHQNRKKAAKASKSAQRDPKNPLSSLTQGQSQQQTAENHEKLQQSQKFTNLGMNVEKIEEFKSDSGSCQAQSISHVQKVLNTHSQTSHIRVDISCTDATETEQILLESGRQ